MPNFDETFSDVDRPSSLKAALLAKALEIADDLARQQDVDSVKAKQTGNVLIGSRYDDGSLQPKKPQETMSNGAAAYKALQWMVGK